MGNRIW